MLLDRLSGIIFDLDNTLVKTKIEYIHQTVNLTLIDVGYKGEATQREAYCFWYEINRDENIKKMWGVEPALFWKAFRKYDTIEGRVANTTIYEDIECLRGLPKNLKTAILTSSIRQIALAEKELVDPYLRVAYFLSSAFNKNVKDKPEPDGVYKCLKRLRLKPERTIMVGDSPLDVLAAQAAGVWDVFLKRDGRGPISCSPSIIIPDLYGLFWI